MILKDQLEIHKQELLNISTSLYELEQRRKELMVIIKALQIGTEREEFLLASIKKEEPTDLTNESE